MIGARNPVPAKLAERAVVTDIKALRAWADEVPENLGVMLRKRYPDVPQVGIGAHRVNGRPVIETLALSGGGPHGAFGAGVLAGWTESGTRPEFEFVTGVSAGALIAPFAFLGPEYDGVLEEIWTTYKTSDLIRVQGLQGLFGGDGLVDTSPLAELIARYLNREVLDRIATEYRRGRLLLVLTTNLDAQRPVVWNMGALAERRTPEAAALFHKIILASASIPGAFPPVRLTVAADGKTFDELHVDGGTTRQLFITPVQAPLRAFDALHPVRPIRRFYVLYNGKLTPEYNPVEQKTLPIAGQAISTLLFSQSEAELYRIYRRTLDGDGAFRLLSIPVTFPLKPNAPFDQGYMTALYKAGRALGRQRDPWDREPPELVPTARRPVPVETKALPKPKIDGDIEAGSFFDSVVNVR